MALVLGLNKQDECIKIGEDIFIYAKTRSGVGQIILRVDAPKDIKISRHPDKRIPNES